MKNIFAIIFATLAGVSTSLEAFINGELGKNTTALVATFISLVVGTIFFFINICLTGNLKTLASFNDINPKLLLGGVLGGLVIYFTVYILSLLLIFLRINKIYIALSKW